ncbi:MAG: DNA methyltransferase [Bacteroidales bacterium]|nr:DNA methyltransferase [Bacteroidales bacterium]
MANNTLQKAKAAKQDEFYTQLADIQNEMNAYLDYNPDVFRDKTILLPCDDPEWSNFTLFFSQNFERFGLKKLISTSYAIESKHNLYGSQLSLFETDYEKTSKKYDANITRSRGKIFVLDRDCNADGCINYHDLKWEYLNGDGDFRSDEVKALRDEADIIVTNPPFSLFRDFWKWTLDAEKKFLMIGNVNSISYKDVFPFIRSNKVWLGATGFMTDMVFGVPEGTVIKASDKLKAEKMGYLGNYTRLGNSCWFTNLDHGRRHEKLQLMTTSDIFKYSKHSELRGKNAFDHYDNYNAIDIPKVDSIPSDYNEVMGVPITFIDKYCPEQFDVLGMASSAGYNKDIVGIELLGGKDARPLINGKNKYVRIFIKKNNSLETSQI